METLLNDFSVGLFIMQAVILLILILLMRKFAWKPILDALQSREDGIQNALDSAEKAKLEMQNLTASNDKLLKEAREMKETMISSAKEEAQVQANAMIAQAQAAIESEKKAAMAELKSHVASLSLEIAEKVVRQELSNKDKQEALVESMLGEATLN